MIVLGRIFCSCFVGGNTMQFFTLHMYIHFNGRLRKTQSLSTHWILKTFSFSFFNFVNFLCFTTSLHFLGILLMCVKRTHITSKYVNHGKIVPERPCQMMQGSLPAMEGEELTISHPCFYVHESLEGGAATIHTVSADELIALAGLCTEPCENNSLKRDLTSCRTTLICT